MFPLGAKYSWGSRVAPTRDGEGRKKGKGGGRGRGGERRNGVDFINVP